MGAWQNQSSSGWRHLEDENRRLKRMYADLSLDHEILKDVVAKKL
jgi:putative transposase